MCHNELQPSKVMNEWGKISFCRTIIKMTGNFGRVRQLRLLMATGNGNGTAGFSLVRSPIGRGPNMFQRAVNKAGLRLVNFDLYENR